MEVQEVPQRRKGPARLYHGLLTVVFLVLFLDSIISLGTFGTVQAKLESLRRRSLVPFGQCILFGSRTEEDFIKLSQLGSCGFVLWGQVSIAIVAFVWIVVSIVMAVIAPRM